MEKVMRVAVLLTGYPVRSETFIEDQITGLRELGCEVTILPMQNGPTPEARAARPWAALRKAWQLGADRIPWQACNVFRHGAYAASLRLFFEAADLTLRQRDPFDVVHAHFGPNGIRAEMLRESGVLRARRWITSFYGYDVSSFPMEKGRNPYASRLFRTGDLFLPLSRAMQRKLWDLGAPRDKTVVHPLGVAVDRLQPAAPTRRANPADGFRVLSLARLVEKKGLADGIRAVAAMSEPNVRYSILGDGPLRDSLQQLIRDLGAQERVRILGWQDRESVARMLREQTDVLLVPSVTAANGDEEGTPTVILEAMACGIPVISTRHAGIPEVVEDGGSGLLADEHDVVGLTQCLERLAANPELCAGMGIRGRAIVLERHDIHKLNSKLLDYYSA